MDLNAWNQQYEAIYGRHLENGAYPADALMGINTNQNQAGWKLPLNDPEKLHVMVWERAMSRNPDVIGGIHFRVNPLRNREYTYREAGQAPDALAWPALIMDWDTADGEHAVFEKGEFAGYRHPQRHEIQELMESIMMDTLRIDSGGGYQSYFILDTPLQHDAEGATALLRRVHQRWADAAKERGFGLDLSVGIKRSQTLRMAGSINTKRDHKYVEIIRHDPSVTYSVEALAAELPELRVPERTARAGTANPVAFIGSMGKGKALAWKFAKNVPASWILEGVWGMELKAGTEDAEYRRYVMPRPDGSLSEKDTHVAVKTGETGVERAYAMANRSQTEFGVEDSSTGLTSWDLVTIIMGGDTDLAELIAKAHKKPGEEMLASLRHANNHRHDRLAA